jgi:hypothetical protein
MGASAFSDSENSLQLFRKSEEADVEVFALKVQLG